MMERYRWTPTCAVMVLASLSACSGTVENGELGRGHAGGSASSGAGGGSSGSSSQATATTTTAATGGSVGAGGNGGPTTSSGATSSSSTVTTSSSGSGGSGGAGSSGGSTGAGGSSGVVDGGTGAPMIEQFETSCMDVPDPDIAASENLVGMVGQWTAYFYKKTGMADHQYKLTASKGSLISDTHIVYDVSSQRWFMTTILELMPNFGQTATQFMVSTDATASSWKMSVPIVLNDLIDNPQPTVTSDKVLVIFHGNDAWVVDKADLMNGDAAVVQPTSTTLKSADNWVAVKYGGMPPSTAYAVTLLDNTHLSWLSVDGTHAANNVNLQVHNVTVPSIKTAPVWGNGGVTINGGQIEAGEVKAMWQNNHLYWAKTFTCDTGTCERLYDIDTSANTATGTDFSLTGQQLWFGVPGVDKYQNVWMLASSSGASGPIGLAFMGKYASGTVYQANKIVPGTTTFTGSGQVRAGDYTSAAQDPVDGSVWLIGMYGAGNPNPLNTEKGNAGCKAVHVIPTQ